MRTVLLLIVSQTSRFMLCRITARILTTPSDKLIALQGITKTLESTIGGPAIADMWKQNLWKQPVWWMSPQSLSSLVLDTGLRFPALSWSWLSADAPVYYHNSQHTKQETYFNKLHSLLTIPSATAKIIGNATSIERTLTCRGPSFLYSFTPVNLRTRGWKCWNRTDPNLALAEWLLDVSCKMPLDVTYVAIIEDGAAKVLVYLCLVPDEKTPFQWKRIGLCHWDRFIWQAANFLGEELEERSFTVV